MQMVDVQLPTSDGRELVLSRYTQPEKDQQLLLQQLKLTLPEQLPPKLNAKAKRRFRKQLSVTRHFFTLSVLQRNII